MTLSGIVIILFVLSCTAGVFGPKLYLYHCGYQLRERCPVFGDQKAFLEGARARLARDADLVQLQRWAAGVVPDRPQKEGAPIHLPNGETIIPIDRQGDGANWGEDGSFILLPGHLPPTLSRLLRPPPRIVVHGDANPGKRYVKVGYQERFGLNIVIGPTNYIYDGGLSALKCKNGIYVFVGGGG